MPGADEQLQVALRFLRATARGRAGSVHEVPGGEAYLDADFPGAHDLNRLVLHRPCSAAEVVAAAEAVLGGAGLGHRLVDVHDLALGRRLTADLAPHGYAGAEELVMAATGPLQRGLPTHPVVALEVGERAAVASAEWRRDQPDWADDLVDQLGRRIRTVSRAVSPTFLAVRGEGGEVLAHADLYLRDGVAQVEEVMTVPAARGRGLASLLVQEAVQRARAAGAGLVFLVADADDWPQHLYRRLGFTDLGRTVGLRAGAG